MKILLEPEDTLFFDRKLVCSPDGTKSKQATFTRVEEYEGQKMLVNLPFSKFEVPMNAKTFGKVQISYMDANVIGVLRKMRPLFTDVNLFVESSNKSTTRRVLLLLMPLIGSIDSIYLCEQETFTSMLALFPAAMYSVKVLQQLGSQLQLRGSIDAYYNWLVHKRSDGEPRQLLIGNISAEQLGILLQTIRERFLVAQNNEGPAPFFARIEHFQRLPNDALLEQTVVNYATGEQLSYKIIPRTNHAEALLISRWPIDVSAVNQQKSIIEWHCFESGKHIMVDPVECDLEGVISVEQKEAAASGSSDFSTATSGTCSSTATSGSDFSAAMNDTKSKKKKGRAACSIM